MALSQAIETKVIGVVEVRGFSHYRSQTLLGETMNAI